MRPRCLAAWIAVVPAAIGCASSSFSGDAGDDAPAIADADPYDDALPVPPRLDFGYYRVDNVPSGGSSSGAEVSPWTNLAYVDWWADARAFDFAEGADMTPVLDHMAGILQRLSAAGLSFVMDVAYGGAWGPRLTKAAILGVAAPHWDRIGYVILGNELELDRATADAALAEWRSALANLGLPPRPIGITLTPAYVLGNPEMLQAAWDFIAIEAYTPACTCDSCGTGSAQQQIAAIAEQVAAMEAAIPAAHDLVMVLQGYDRNGAFTDADLLAEINRATYFDMVKGEPRYRAMLVFAWDREGSTCAGNPYPQFGHGTSELAAVRAVHQAIWDDLTAP